MARHLEKIEDFAKLIFQLQQSDLDVNMGVGGFTGVGKTTFSIQLQIAHSKVSGIEWSFDRMTWSRKELLKWIDGEKDTKAGQLPEYSAILPDELFAMFYRRNWYEDEQIDAIATFNMCRDRHLFLCGNVPNFWELDTGFTNRIRFYVFIPTRGVAWVFEQENNPFCNDNWNVLENRKNFRKRKNPYSIPNFVCEIHYDDLDPELKQDYLAIRNTKRVEAITDNKTEKTERYGTVKQQRDAAFKFLFNYNQQVVDAVKGLSCKGCRESLDGAELNQLFSNKAIADVAGLSQEVVRLIRIGLR